MILLSCNAEKRAAEKKAPLCKGSSRVSGWGIVFILDHYLIALANSRKWHKISCPLFLLMAQGSKEKAIKKKTPFRKGYSPLHPRHPLKKVDENFQCLCHQYNKIKSFHGSGELSVKASLEKITHYAVFTAQTNHYVPKKFFSQESFWLHLFSKRWKKKKHD